MLAIGPLAVVTEYVIPNRRWLEHRPNCVVRGLRRATAASLGLRSSLVIAMMSTATTQGPNYAGPELRRARTTQGPNYAGPELRRARTTQGPNYAGPELRRARTTQGPRGAGPRRQRRRALLPSGPCA